jgi:oligopeptide/dipeptide ABC transporter ATP-binding protein
MAAAVIELDDVRLQFATPLGPLVALRGVTLSVPERSIVALVGESGCGKTMTGRTILRLLPGNATVAGKVLFRGSDLLVLRIADMQRLRGGKIAMIFQDPATALNPVFTIGQQLAQILRYHGVGTENERKYRAVELLSEVGLPDPKRVLMQYPHELSGGMQQRAMIAMALSPSPEVLIADEPTTSLDVTIQAQILELLIRLQEARGLTVILITHDMAVVRRACQRVAVLYAGRVVEEGPVDGVLSNPQHPYTQALLASLPSASARRMPLTGISGMLPDGRAQIEGCVFAPRCPFVMDVCRESSPETTDTTDPSHTVACWLRQRDPAQVQ